MSEKTFEITLSGQALEWLEAELRDGTYTSASEMVQALIERDYKALISLLEEGDQSGLSGMTMKGLIEDIRLKRADEAA
mgnify:CR=1 FL=1